MVSGSTVPPGYVFTAWSPSGERVYLTGGGPATGREPETAREIISYELGDDSAERIDVDVRDFYDVAAG